jgi:hypothetical protein
MKVTVKEKTELGYPKLMISDVGQIIMALSDNQNDEDCIIGVMIKSNGYPFCGTMYSENISKSKFVEFNGTITIEQ